MSDFKSVPRDRLDLQPESSADNRQSKEALPATKSGAKPGTIYGETDEVGHRAAVNKVTANDYQATLLHQFGIDHTQLTYHHGGRSQKLTNDRPARVVREILS